MKSLIATYNFFAVCRSQDRRGISREGKYGLGNCSSATSGTEGGGSASNSGKSMEQGVKKELRKETIKALIGRLNVPRS
jgi:hypothetical protein